MKKILSLLSVLFLTFGCYDDSDIRNELRDHEERLAKLETLCKQMNTNISALQTIVSTLQRNVYITAMTPVTEGDDIIGYTLLFSNSESVTIYHGKDGADGVNGTSPSIGVRQDTDGIYYWTLDGEWLLDAGGKKVQAVGRDGSDGEDGKTPQLKIEDGYWMVSYDSTDWSILGEATGESANLIEITQDAESVFFKLKDGTILTVAKGSTTGDDFHVSVSDIFECSASFEGRTEGNKWSEMGVILSMESGCPMDTTSRLIPITEPDEEGKFVVRIEGLASGTKYYYSGYAKDGDVYVFGEEKSFVTKPVQITHAIEILEVGTRSAKVLVNWEMSCFDPSIILGLKYGDNGSTLGKLSIESPQQSGSYEFDLEGFSPNGDYECSFYYILNGVEKEGDRHDLNLIEVPFGQEGLNFRFDKSVIKADGVDCVTFNILYDGIDVSDKTTLFLVEYGNYVPVTGMSFSTSLEGEYLFFCAYKSEFTEDIKIYAIEGEMPDFPIDPSPERTDFSHRVFLNQHTGANCWYCPFMTRFLRESLVDDVKDMAVLSVLRNYPSPEPGFANVKNPSNVWPYLTFDNVVSYDYNTPAEKFRGDIRAAVASPAPVGISANPYYNESTKQIIVTVAVKAAVAGEYNVGLWLMQDNYYEVQAGRPDETYNTHHNNVRVAEPENTRGHPLGYLSIGQTAERSFVFDIKDTWWTDSYNYVNFDDLHFAAFVTTRHVTNVGFSFKNVNVIDFKYNEVKPFEYLVEAK